MGFSEFGVKGFFNMDTNFETICFNKKRLHLDLKLSLILFSQAILYFRITLPSAARKLKAKNTPPEPKNTTKKHHSYIF